VILKMCPFGIGCDCGSNGERREVTREVVQVVMIPRKYCGALFQQTVTFCPHCGAKRTA